MQIAVNTDFSKGTGNPEPWLQLASQAGFTHIHWCHQWNTDFLYGQSEIKQIKKWFSTYQLALLDIHSSVGPEKNWFSLVEYEREAGVELVANRLRMFKELDGTGSVIMHLPAIREGYSPAERDSVNQLVNQLRKSLDSLVPLCHELQARISLENTPGDTFEVIKAMFAEYPADAIGLCYDSGHGNIGGEAKGLQYLDDCKDRLITVHLHDNDGVSDQHQPPFMGTVNWQKLTQIIAKSAYRNPLSFEISTRCTPFTGADFIADAYSRCLNVASMLNPQL